MKLLLIEDEPELAKSIQAFLTGKEFVCEWTNNISVAFDKISTYDYDCILLDLMPSGFGTLPFSKIRHLGVGPESGLYWAILRLFPHLMFKGTVGLHSFSYQRSKSF